MEANPEFLRSLKTIQEEARALAFANSSTSESGARLRLTLAITEAEDSLVAVGKSVPLKDRELFIQAAVPALSALASFQTRLPRISGSEVTVHFLEVSEAFDRLGIWILQYETSEGPETPAVGTHA